MWKLEGGFTSRFIICCGASDVGCLRCCLRLHELHLNLSCWLQLASSIAKNNTLFRVENIFFNIKPDFLRLNDKLLLSCKNPYFLACSTTNKYCRLSEVLTVSCSFVFIFRRVGAVSGSCSGAHAEDVPSCWF